MTVHAAAGISNHRVETTLAPAAVAVTAPHSHTAGVWRSINSVLTWDVSCDIISYPNISGQHPSYVQWTSISARLFLFRSWTSISLGLGHTESWLENAFANYFVALCATVVGEFCTCTTGSSQRSRYDSLIPIRNYTLAQFPIIGRPYCSYALWLCGEQRNGFHV